MVGEETVWAIPAALESTVSIVLYIIGAVGIFVIIYIMFSLINAIINKKRNRIIEQIAQDVQEIKLALKRRK